MYNLKETFHSILHNDWKCIEEMQFKEFLVKLKKRISGEYFWSAATKDNKIMFDSGGKTFKNGDDALEDAKKILTKMRIFMALS